MGIRVLTCLPGHPVTCCRKVCCEWLLQSQTCWGCDRLVVMSCENVLKRKAKWASLRKEQTHALANASSTESVLVRRGKVGVSWSSKQKPWRQERLYVLSPVITNVITAVGQVCRDSLLSTGTEYLLTYFCFHRFGSRSFCDHAFSPPCPSNTNLRALTHAAFTH